MNIAFIPVRCGSVSIPLKNIKTFNNKPLVYWTIKASQESDVIDKIYIATDCHEISREILKMNFSKVQIFKRSKENATSNSSSESVLLEFINFYNLDSKDNIIFLQATSPFTQKNDIDKAFWQYVNTKADSLLSAVREKRFYWNEDGTAINYNYEKRPRRQEFKGTLMENGAFYISSVSRIIKHNNRLSGKIYIYEMPRYTSIELDEEDDWEIAEKLHKKYYPQLFCSNKKKIKLFLTDVDGVLTDAGMYYSNSGEELKKFNTHDGKAFEILRQHNIKTGLITGENTEIVKKRALKLKVDYVYQGIQNKLEIAKLICHKENISLSEVAYIGDDINDLDLLDNAGLAACPVNAVPEVKALPEIVPLQIKGGDGAVREFIRYMINHNQI